MGPPPQSSGPQDGSGRAPAWRGFARRFLAVFAGGLAALYLFVLLVDPYGIGRVSLPLERAIVSPNQRFMYRQIIASRRYDSFVIGTSTSRLLDPEVLNPLFSARFANLAMDAMTAWEQQTVAQAFLREAGPPKVFVLGLDVVWCDADADRNRVTFRGFPAWLYDDDPWNDYLYLLNGAAVGLAFNTLGFNLGLVPERHRRDGFAVFVPPEEAYDPARARAKIWRGRQGGASASEEEGAVSEEERRAWRFPALTWLDALLTEMPASTTKVLAFTPVHIAAQPAPGTAEALREAACKEQVAAIARRTGALLVDWRFASSLTRDDMKYWDHLHYRLPVAERIAHDLAHAALENREAGDGTNRILVPLQR